MPTAASKRGYKKAFGSVDRDRDSATSLQGNDLQETQNRGCSYGCRDNRPTVSPDGSSCPLDAELQLLLDAWPKLPQHIRQAIVTLIEGAQKADDAAS